MPLPPELERLFDGGDPAGWGDALARLAATAEGRALLDEAVRADARAPAWTAALVEERLAAGLAHLGRGVDHRRFPLWAEVPSAPIPGTALGRADLGPLWEEVREAAGELALLKRRAAAAERRAEATQHRLEALEAWTLHREVAGWVAGGGGTPAALRVVLLRLLRAPGGEPPLLAGLRGLLVGAPRLDRAALLDPEEEEEEDDVAALLQQRAAARAAHLDAFLAQLQARSPVAHAALAPHLPAFRALLERALAAPLPHVLLRGPAWELRTALLQALAE